MDDVRPFPSLAIAVLCDKVSDIGSTVKLEGIRTIWTAKPGQRSTVVRYYVEFLSRGFVGELDLATRMVTPDVRSRTTTTRLHFEAGMDGVRNSGPIDLNLEEPGLYWLDIILGDQFMTRIPVGLAGGSDSSISGGLPDIPGDHAGPYVSIASFVGWSDMPKPDQLSVLRVPPYLPVTMDEAGHVDQGNAHLLAQLLGWIRLIPGAMAEGPHVARLTWAFPDGEVSPTTQVTFTSGMAALPADLQFKVQVDFEKPGPYELRVEIEGIRLVLPMELRPPSTV